MLPFILISVAIAVVAFELADRRDNNWYELLVFLIVPAMLIPTFYSHNQKPSINTYPYQAEVKIGSNDQTATIYFSNFTQLSDLVIINGYEVAAWRWFDLDYGDVITTPLQITLLDNNDKFVYTDRGIGQVINEKQPVNTPTLATQ